jgi:glutathione peroxidase
MWFTKLIGRNTTSKFNTSVDPIVSVYTIPAVLNDGKQLDLNEFKGKKILMVNTASDCGYTDQYESLEKLYQQYKETLVVLVFPRTILKNRKSFG